MLSIENNVKHLLSSINQYIVLDITRESTSDIWHLRQDLYRGVTVLGEFDVKLRKCCSTKHVLLF